MNSTFRERVARLERPLLLAGLALVTLHLVDLALSGADTSLPGVAVIVAIPLAWALLGPRTTRPTRLATGVVFGLVAIGFGVASHGLHAVNSGLDWRDVTGLGYIAGGALLAASGLAAIAAPRRTPRRAAPGWRAAHAGGWLAGAVALLAFAVMPFRARTSSPTPRVGRSRSRRSASRTRRSGSPPRTAASWRPGTCPRATARRCSSSHGSGGSRGG